MSEAMSETKTWRVKGAHKGYSWLIYCVGLMFIPVVFRNGLLFLVISLVVLYLIFSSRREVFYIKTSENEIESYLNYVTRTDNWDDITGYHHTDNIICLDSRDRSPIIIDKDLLEEADEFTAYLDEKLKRLSETECFECGAVIVSSQSKCPNCGWTWEED